MQLQKALNPVIYTNLKYQQSIKKANQNLYLQEILFSQKIHTVRNNNCFIHILYVQERNSYTIDNYYCNIILEPPGAPGEPSIVDFDNKSVTLRWAKPKDDGGRPISHYIIQKKDKFGGWFDALVTDDTNCVATIDDLEARVPGLSEGKWYQFRVIAVNKAGESDPSPQTRPHLCRHKNRKSKYYLRIFRFRKK